MPMPSSSVAPRLTPLHAHMHITNPHPYLPTSPTSTPMRLPPYAHRGSTVDARAARNRWRSDPPPRTRGELRNTIAVAPLPLRLTLPEPDRAYGTRLASVVLVRRDGSVLFVERDMWELGRDHDGGEGGAGGTPGEAPRPRRADPARQRVFRFRLDVEDALLPARGS